MAPDPPAPTGIGGAGAVGASTPTSVFKAVVGRRAASCGMPELARRCWGDRAAVCCGSVLRAGLWGRPLEPQYDERDRPRPSTTRLGDVAGPRCSHHRTEAQDSSPVEAPCSRWTDGAGLGEGAGRVGRSRRVAREQPCGAGRPSLPRPRPGQRHRCCACTAPTRPAPRVPR